MTLSARSSTGLKVTVAPGHEAGTTGARVGHRQVVGAVHRHARGVVELSRGCRVAVPLGGSQGSGAWVYSTSSG
jgi:hypothetical protein